MREKIASVNTPSWQARALVEARQADLMAAAAEVRRAAGVPRRKPSIRVGVAERTGLFLIRRGEALRQDAVRHRPASWS